MSDMIKNPKSISEIEINAQVKQALMDEFKVDVGFKYLTIEDAMKYVTFTAIQRVKQRLNSKKERDEYNMLKKKHPELFKKLQNK